MTPQITVDEHNNKGVNEHDQINKSLDVFHINAFFFAFVEAFFK